MIQQKESQKFSCPHTYLQEDPDKLLCYKVARVILSKVMKVSEAESFIFHDLAELDYSQLTVKEIIDKINDFIKENPTEEEYMIFLHFLALYPVSMCKRDVSHLLKNLIGLLYRTTQREPNKDGTSYRFSFDDLAHIFVRSKATIKSCVDDSATLWYKIQRDMARITPQIEEKQQINAQTNEHP